MCGGGHVTSSPAVCHFLCCGSLWHPRSLAADCRCRADRKAVPAESSDEDGDDASEEDSDPEEGDSVADTEDLARSDGSAEEQDDEGLGPQECLPPPAGP